MKINSTELSRAQYQVIEAFRNAKENEEYWGEVEANELKRFGYSPNKDVADHWGNMVKKRREMARALIPSFDARVRGDTS